MTSKCFYFNMFLGGFVMEDYYTIERLKNEIEKTDFLKIQRAIYPILKDDKQDGNMLSKLLVENYFVRLVKNGIDVKNFDIDRWLCECSDERLDEFARLVNPDISVSLFDKYSYNEMLYTQDKINTSIRHGQTITSDKKVLVDYLGGKFYTNKFQTDTHDDKIKPYIHYDYDSKMFHLLKVIKEKADVKFVSDEMKRYGLDNFDELNYDQISTLLTTILSNGNDQIGPLISKMYEVLKVYDKKSIHYNLSNLELKYLSNDKLNRLYKVLKLAIMDDETFDSMYVQSEIDLDLADVYDSSMLRHFNDVSTNLDIYNLVDEEIKKRRESHFNNGALYYAKVMSTNDDKRRKLKI